MPDQVDATNNTTQNTQTPSTEEGANQPESFEAWLDTQDDSVKKMYGEHVAGLRNTVKATRDERDNYKSQLNDALKKVERGSEAEKSLQEALGRVEAIEKRAAFFEDALRPEIGCRNPKAAYALAVAENLFTRSGAPDWNAVKEAAPELFGTVAPRGTAGNGTTSPPKAQDMNTIIRQKAGAI